MGAFGNTFSKVRSGAFLNLKPPTLLTSSFTVDTILGQLNWVNNAGADAQFEVYSATNGGTESFLGTTIAGATSYQDLTCQQNASVVYRIRVKKGTKFSDFVSATALNAPLCWKTNQATLQVVSIQTLNITVGKTVTVNYSDGTSQPYTGNNSNITKMFAATGQYNVWLSGDVNYITTLSRYGQGWIYGDITNWMPITSCVFLAIDGTSSTGNAIGLTIGSAQNTMYVHNTNISGSLPNIQHNATLGLSLVASGCNLSDSNPTAFRKAMATFNISGQKVVFPTVNIDKLLKALADYYQANAPTANCTINMSGANMGIPTGGSSNADLTRLVGYYTTASKTATVVVRTS